MTGRAGAGAARAGPGSPPWSCPEPARRWPGNDLALIGALPVPIDRLGGEVRQQSRSDPRVKVLTQLPSTGPVTALIILAETVGITRFGPARQLASWDGLTPTVHGSDRTLGHGHIAKQGPAWLRWALCQAAQTAKRHPPLRRQLPGHRPPPWQEDRHHRDRPQTPHPRLSPAHRLQRRRACEPGRVAKPGQARVSP